MTEENNEQKKDIAASTGRRRLTPGTIKALVGTTLAGIAIYGLFGYAHDRSRKSTENKDQICAEVAEELTGDSKIDRKTCDKIAETVNFIKKRERAEERANKWKDKKSKSIAEGLGVGDYKKVQRVIRQKMDKKPNQRTVKGMQMRTK